MTNNPYMLSTDPASNSKAKQFPRSMADHLIRSLLMRGEDAALLVAIRNAGDYARIEKALWGMNSLACVVQNGYFKATSNIRGNREIVLVSSQDHGAFMGVRFHGKPVTVITDEPLRAGSALFRAAAAHDAVTITLEASL